MRRLTSNTCQSRTQMIPANVILALVSSAYMIAGIASYLPSLKWELISPAKTSQISLTVNLFAALQGPMPLFWSAIMRHLSWLRPAKLYGLSLCFDASKRLGTLNEIVGFGIWFHSFQVKCSVATLADIFEPAERGTKVGVYYMAPLLGVDQLGPNYRRRPRDRLQPARPLLVTRGDLGAKLLAEKESCNPSLPADSEKQDRNSRDADAAAPDISLSEIKLTLRDVNLFKPLGLVLRRMNNIVIFLPMVTLLFGLNIVILFTTAGTLGSAYGYTPLKIGLVLLSFGLEMSWAFYSWEVF
ncbi:Vacuolar DHA amino acid exporter [Mycena venus]|uniref:Vacuolar DHA amino acid exporter n=1 Tax=Mycena venus TaxID=2733690 RepID=A0A8H7DFN7_9AGAR|nr:Vacuolar DHA amino acid exporter [Mycena venus]